MAKKTLGDMMLLVAVVVSFVIGVLWYTTEPPRRFDVMIDSSDTGIKTHPCTSDPKRSCVSMYVSQ